MHFLTYLIQALVLVAEFLAMVLLVVGSLEEAEASGHGTLEAQWRLRLDWLSRIYINHSLARLY